MVRNSSQIVKETIIVFIVAVQHETMCCSEMPAQFIDPRIVLA